MNINEFFNLPEEQRELLTQLHNKQKRIRLDKERIELERRKLATRELNLQLECEHPFATKTYKAYENEFGNLTGGGEYNYHCDDCGQRWTEYK